MKLKNSFKTESKNLLRSFILLSRWQGSVYKLIWQDFLVYNVMYFSISALYRFGLNDKDRDYFEQISLNLHTLTEMIPIAFALGFFVSVVVQRWWAQFENVPWPDKLAIYISSSIWGNDEEGRMIRRTVMRYVNLGNVMALWNIAVPVAKRFPTLESLVDAGFLTEVELEILEGIENHTSMNLYWLPYIWASSIVAKARNDGRIKNDVVAKLILEEINRNRGYCGTLICYDWVNIPLVYVQVVTIAVWGFFGATLIGSQFLDPSKHYERHSIDYVFPVFTYIQFIFYMGWLKVAEALVNPFGEDDDDFDLDFIIDRNLTISYMMVDETHCTVPTLSKDRDWEDRFTIHPPISLLGKKSNLDTQRTRNVMDLDSQLYPFHLV